MIKTAQKFHHRSFKQIVSDFEKRTTKWSPLKNAIRISDHFGNGIGMQTLAKSLDIERDFKGVYLFIKNSRPFYVGISKHVLERINQHVKGTSHFTSSLAYRIAANEFKRKNGSAHKGGRNGLDFGLYGSPAKANLFKCEVAWLQVDDDVDLFLYEVFLSMKFGTLHYNKFKTH